MKTIVKAMCILFILSSCSIDNSGGSSSENEFPYTLKPDISAVDNFYDTSTTGQPNGYIDKDFVLFWYMPVRAYPGLELTHKFIVYEAFNQELKWSLIGAPSEMSIDVNSGILTWTPETEGIYDVTVRVERKEAGFDPVSTFIERSFTISVNKEEFIFVSKDSSAGDSNDGTLDSPLRTITAAIAKAGSNGRTIYVRANAGAYHEFCTNDTVTGQLRLKGEHSADNPLVISSYPGDPDFEIDCQQDGWGLSLGGSYNVVQHAVVKNANMTGAGEPNQGAIVINGDNNIVQSSKATNSCWSNYQNCTNVLVDGAKNPVLDSVTATDASGTGEPIGNTSNFLFYLDHNAEGTFYVLNCTSERSITGYKLKHPGPDAKLVFHNSRSLNDHIGFQVGNDYASVRYCFVEGASSWGIVAGLSEASMSPNEGPILLEHNTVINTGSAGIITYRSYALEPVIVKNIIYQKQQPALSRPAEDEYTAQYVSKYIDLWVFQTDISNTDALINQNVYYSIEGESDFDFRRQGLFDTYNLSQWQQLGYDLESVNADPLFEDDYTLSEGSPAIFSDGEFAGCKLPEI